MNFRILILGAGGFVGGHLRYVLEDRLKGAAEITATSLKGVKGESIAELDILDECSVVRALEKIKPTHVINLAGLASPDAARQAPKLAWHLHALAPESLGRLILRYIPESWLFHVSSGLVYGKSALSGDHMTEEAVLSPIDPYAVTKAAGDLAIGALAEQGLKCVRLRPFNHIGPGQTEDFVVPAFASQLIKIAKGVQPPVIHVGNLEAKRDFLDVRDVVSAYVTLIEQSGSLKPGAVYNVASGTAIRIREILDRLISISGLKVEVLPDPHRQRGSDLPQISGSASKLTTDTGWSPRHSISETLGLILRTIDS